MTCFSFSLLALVAAGASALSIPGSISPASESTALLTRQTSDLTPGCQNTGTSRKCWGEHDINTNYYDTIFKTGRTVEYWLTIDEIDCAPDGFKRKCQVANGTMPGPPITADWGDDIVLHVTNNLPTNGTSLHFHGIRMLNNTQYDGVPGVTQCPIPPGDSMTYKFHASQYGTAMYHGHFTLQYSMGLYGPLIINGPATANYDEELETIFLSDWDHHTAFQHWGSIATFNVTFNGLPTGVINGKNTGNCTLTNTTAPDSNCLNGGEKYEIFFEQGKKYRLRVANIATEAWFQFSIDGHKFTVISADMVPIVPFETDSVLVGMGQRYDIIVEANAEPGDYWLRSGFVGKCIPNGSPDNITAIVRYNRNSTEEPKTVNNVVAIETCRDEPAPKVVPWVPIDLTNMKGGIQRQNVTGFYYLNKYLRWSIDKPTNGFMWTNWSQPALGDALSGNLDASPESNNLFLVGTNSTDVASHNNGTSDVEWVVLVIEELTPVRGDGVAHPMHLHGHDFLVLASEPKVRWNGTTKGWDLSNPVRRDTATLPQNGYMVIAFALDNPGLWFLHCHVAWHASQGFGATIVESPGLIKGVGAGSDWDTDFAPTCKNWNDWYPTSEFQQEDSGV